MDNATLITALMATVDAYIDGRIKKALEDHQAEVDMDRLRELIAPIVESQMEAKIDQAFEAHHYEFDHNDFVTGDQVNEKIDNALDDRNLVTDDDIEAKVEEAMNNFDIDDHVTDAVRNLSFTVRVD